MVATKEMVEKSRQQEEGKRYDIYDALSPKEQWVYLDSTPKVNGQLIDVPKEMKARGQGDRQNEDLLLKPVALQEGKATIEQVRAWRKEIRIRGMLPMFHHRNQITLKEIYGLSIVIQPGGLEDTGLIDGSARMALELEKNKHITSLLRKFAPKFPIVGGRSDFVRIEGEDVADRRFRIMHLS